MKAQNSVSGGDKPGQPDLTVWFDGECPLCVREIRFMRRLDSRRRINFVEVNSLEACPIDKSELLARFHAREHGKEIVSGAAAFAAMWRRIPLFRPVGELARIKPVLWVLERLYVMFLSIRPWLQRRLRMPQST